MLDIMDRELSNWIIMFLRISNLINGGYKLE